MSHTPFFPAWRPCLAPMGSRVSQCLSTLRRFTLAELEAHFAPCLPESLFPKPRKRINSRDRVYPQRLTFWCFLWQSLNPASACRQVVRQVQALHILLGKPCPSFEDGAYCKARQRLSKEALLQALEATAKAVQTLAAKTSILQSRRLLAVDGSMVNLQDTRANQNRYPKFKNGYHDLGFPQLRLVVLFCLGSGALLARATGNKHDSELRLFSQLRKEFKTGDVVVADQGFGNFVVMSLLRSLGADFIGRSSRQVDCRKGQSLGPRDRLVNWRKGKRQPPYLSQKEWESLPQEQLLRVVRGRIAQKGFRVKEMSLVTTLLDAKEYPAHEILEAYLRRWRLEMCLDDLKTTLKMEHLRCKTPAMVEKELLIHLIAHNLIRWLMAKSAATHEVDLGRISFKGTVDAFREFSHAMSQAPSRKKRRELWSKLLAVLAEDLVPERPGRREPRARKKQHRKYPRLNKPRTQFRDRIKRHERRKRKRLNMSMLK